MKDASQIVVKLNRLAELVAQRDGVRLEYEERRDALMAPLLESIASQLADLESAYKEESAELDFKVGMLTEEIKQAVLLHGSSVKGTHLQAVWSKPRVKWDSQALDGYALNHPELFAFRTEGEPVVSIRAV